MIQLKLLCEGCAMKGGDICNERPQQPDAGDQVKVKIYERRSKQ